MPSFAQQKDTVEAFENGDAAALAALYTDDTVEVTNEGPIYGRDAIEKHYTDVLKEAHFSKRDQYSPQILGTAGDEEWSTGEWSQTSHGSHFALTFPGSSSCLGVTPLPGP